MGLDVLNCGIAALRRIKEIQNVSMYSLIHLARDNGINLKICKVEVKDLASVKRPAIFHANNHYLFIKDGEPIPEANYSGYVLTSKVTGMLISHDEAKRIFGQKSASSFIRPIITAIAGIINPFLGAAVGAAQGAYDVSRSGSNEWWRIPTGAVIGGTLSGAPAIAGLAAAAQELPGAIKTGDFLRPITAGVGTFALGKGAGGFKTGYQAAIQQGGTGFKALGAGFRNVATGSPFQQATTPSGSMSLLPRAGAQVASQINPAMTLASGGIGNAYGQELSGVNYATGAGSIGTNLNRFGIERVPLTESIQQRFGNIPGATTAATTAASERRSYNFGVPQLAAATASLAAKPSQYKGDVATTYGSTLKRYFGDNPLPAATQTELLKYIQTPLDDLVGQLGVGNERVIEGIETAYANRKQELVRAYNQAGQTIATSSDLREEINKLDDSMTKDVTLANQELRDQNLGRAIQAKQFALSNSLSNNQFEENLAVELATLIGQEEQLKLAIRQDDYETFQNIMAQILYMGYDDVTVNV